MYKVVRKFKDSDGHIFDVNDMYPRDGQKKPAPARIKKLATKDNKYGHIYIEKIEEK